MNAVYRKMRLVTIGIVAAASIVAGMIAVWRLAPRNVMESTPTWVYLGILAFLVCPVLTIAAWAWDRKAAQQELLEIEARKMKMESARAEVEPLPPVKPAPVAPPREASPRRVPRANHHRAIRHWANKSR